MTLMAYQFLSGVFFELYNGNYFMINKLTSFTLNLLKTNLSIVLIFYVSGFLSFLAYYRVLGLPYIAGSSQLYAELAGKNLLVILQTFIFLITEPDYFIENINALNWVGNALYFWLAMIILLVIISLIFKLFPQNFIIRKLQQPFNHNSQNIYAPPSLSYVVLFKFILFSIAIFCLLRIETQTFKIEAILQPSVNAKLQQQIFNAEKKSPPVSIQKRMDIASDLNSDSKEVVKYFFSIAKTKDILGKDARRLNALMLMILMVSITTIMLVQNRHYTFIKYVIFIFVLAQAILIPFNYGILGVKYQYPVVSLDYSEKDKLIHKEKVFLLAKSKETLVIYERYNFLKISYIPQSSVIHFEQIFLSSPFSNCPDKPREFKPCEFYKID